MIKYMLSAAPTSALDTKVKSIQRRNEIIKKAIQPARRKRKTGNCPLDHGAVQNQRCGVGRTTNQRPVLAECLHPAADRTRVRLSRIPALGRRQPSKID